MKTNNKDYILMPMANTYALGVEAIRESYANGECPLQPLYTRQDGSRIVRPLTFRENIQARVDDYNTLKNADGSLKTDDERLRLFNKLLDSCTGIAYKKDTTKFKIVPKSLDLIGISPKFNEPFMHVDYEGILEEEFDSRKDKYGHWLPQEEVICFPAWLAAVEGDNALLSEYANIVFSFLKKLNYAMTGMAFCVTPNKEKRLGALYVGDFDSNSAADGNYVLNGGGSFLCVAPPQKILQGEQ